MSILLAAAILAAGAPRPPAEETLLALIRAHGPALLVGYRMPVADDVRDDWAEYGDYLQNPPHRLSADFNGDGVVDHAFILLGETGYGIRLAVLASKAVGFAAHTLEEFDGRDAFTQRRYIIQTVRPGRYQTARGKGYDVPDDDPDYITLEHPGIDFIYTESANTYYFWDASTQKFRSIQISD